LAQAHEHEQREEERRLGERGERGLTRAAHSLERGAGVERGGDREEAAEPEEIGVEHEVALERQRSGRLAERNQERRQRRGGHRNRRPGQEHPRGRVREHAILAEQLQQVVPGLEQWSAAPARDARLRALDHAEQQRRERDRRDEVHGDTEQRHRSSPPATSSATITVTRM
jgi:hypothetical protein